MDQNFEISSWHASAHKLIAVAAGREPASLVLRGVKWVNVQSREIIPDIDLAIAAGRFAYCGPDASHCIDEDTDVVDCEGLYALPGFCDGHMHVESGMLTPARFAEAVIPHGTTTMFVDPHEIANVLGLDGVRLMHDEARLQPVNMFVQMPSCAPSAPGLETPGAEITPADVEEAMRWPGIAGLGEMMNYAGVVGGNPNLLAEIASAQMAGKTVGGHYASPDLGPPFHAYLAAGPADDHEGTREIDAIARVRQGMRSMMRLGSAWYDVESQITAVTERGLDPRNFILCTDDCHSGTLVNVGHMNRAIKHAIECGCEPLVAIQMATINTATHFGMERELGSIAPGRRADVVLTSDLSELPVLEVFARGRKIADRGELLVQTPRIAWPEIARKSVKIGKRLEAGDFAVQAPAGANAVRARVIGIIENQAPTQALVENLEVEDGSVRCDSGRGISYLALVDRHRASGKIVKGFVKGFGYSGAMAIASTVAHDCHHMVVVGTDLANMAVAANRLAETDGGVSVWRDEEELALIRLPYAGLMSDRPARQVAAEAEQVNAAMAECGCALNNAFMQHSLLALAVIPELRISDLGLVDVTRFELTGLFVED